MMSTSQRACALCGQSKKLCRSHIIPDFLYGPVRNAERKMSTITGRGRHKRGIIQDGLVEDLLCEHCEHLLNTQYEQPFHIFWFGKGKQLPENIGADGVTISYIDYARFKLFHLSVLFRCSLSRLPEFAQVQLGPHEQRMRDMLLQGNPGHRGEYPIQGYVLVRGGVPEWRMIAAPLKYRFDGHKVYEMVYGGCIWHCVVSSHSTPGLVDASLQPSGVMHLLPERWDETNVVRTAARRLRQQ
jgi:hypothetical protein